MNTYISELLNQFIKAKGYTKVDYNSSTFKEEFNRWLIRREEIQYNYLDLLDYMELNVIYNEHVCEVGKGKHDTVTQYGDTLLISPYVYDVAGTNPRIKVDVNKDNLLMYGTINEIDCFLLQNAYNNDHLKILVDISNRNSFNVILGVYGFIDDKDRVEKMNKLRELSHLLNNVPIEEDFTDSDYGYYCYAIATEIYNRANDYIDFGNQLIKKPKRYIS